MATMTTTKSELRKFGLLVGGIFAAWAAYTGWRRGIHVSTYVAGGLGAFLLLFGAAAPRLLAPLHFVWMRLAAVLGFINTRILLGLIFFVFMTPFAFVGRLFGHDPLDRRKRKAGESYWRDYEERADPERYKRQF